MERGILTTVTGCMYSSKSSILITFLRHLQNIAEERVILFRPKIDTRTDGSDLETRDGVKWPATVIKDPKEALIHLNGKTVAAFDEMHFFDPSLMEVVLHILGLGMNVYADGLDTDFRGEAWKTSALLIGIAQERIFRKAVCDKCKTFNTATHTQRLIDGKPAEYDSPLILPGGYGDELYQARCSKCYEPPVNPTFV